MRCCRRTKRPVSVLVWLACLFSVFFHLQPVRALTNGVAMLPPMGYNSWYGFGSGMNEPVIKSIADAMATNGMLAAGYNYINLDDGWPGYRDTNGVIVPDTNKYPSGMKALGDYLHAKGFKFGIYQTAGSNTCAGYIASANHMQQDANTYASWGVDYVKWEGCNVSPYEINPRAQIYTVRAQRALARTGRPIVFSASIAQFENWVPQYVNLWRGTGDINGQWSTVLSHIDYVSRTPQFARPDGWNDMDVMPIGLGLYTDPEIGSIFSTWCILTSPLLVLNNGGNRTNFLCNAEAIAVNQDPNGIQGVCVVSNGDFQVFRKPYGSSNSTTIAVVFFNRGTNTGNVTAAWSDLGLPPGVATVRSLWDHAMAGNFTNSYTASLGPHASQFVKIVSGATMPLPLAGTDYLSDLPWMAGFTNTANFPNGVPLLNDTAGTKTPIKLHGVVYPKGLGMNSATKVSYFLGHAVTRFQSDIGVDDIAGIFGGVQFRVYVDSVLQYDSGPMTAASPKQTIDLDVSGHNVVTLESVPTTGANSFADWAGARFIVPAQPTALTEVTVGTNLMISWNATPGALSYNLKRSTSSSGPYTNITTGTFTSFVDTTATPYVIYYYVVSANDVGGETENSPYIQAVFAPFWINADDSASQDWNLGLNWLNTSNTPDRAGLQVFINSTQAGDQTINLSQSVTIGHLNIGVTNGSASYNLTASPNASLFWDANGSSASLIQIDTAQPDTISIPFILQSPLEIQNLSTNPLTLSGPIGVTNLNISNDSAGPVNLTGAISGTTSLSHNGSGILILGGSNSFTGNIAVTQGTLRAGNSAAFGNADVVTITNNAALDVNGFALGGTPVLVMSNGPDGLGAIVSSAATPQTNALRSLTLIGDTTLGGSGRWDVRGAIKGMASGTLSSGSGAFNLNKMGSNRITLADLVFDPAIADIDIQQGTLAFEGKTSSMGNPTNMISVESGATLAFDQTARPLTKNVTLIGDGVTTTLASIDGTNAISGSVILEQACIIGVNAGILTLSGPVSGPGSLTKKLGGTLSIDGTNLFIGSTSVNGGTLALLNSNALSGSPGINLTAGTVLDTSAVAGGFRLASNQFLGGGGAINGNFIVGPSAMLVPSNFPATLTFSNALTLLPGSTCAFKINHSPATNDAIHAGGILTYAGGLTITTLGNSALVAGDAFKLFDAPAYSGGIATIAPQIPGPGLLWDTSSMASDGVLRIVAGTIPIFTGAKLKGGSLSIIGSGGKANGVFYVISSPNAALPMVQWTRIATNQFDASGNFNFTNSASANSSATFYAVQLP